MKLPPILLKDNQLDIIVDYLLLVRRNPNDILKYSSYFYFVSSPYNYVVATLSFLLDKLNIDLNIKDIDIEFITYKVNNYK